MKPNVTKNYRELLFQTSAEKVLRVMCTWPDKEFSLSDLAREAGVAKPHIGKILDELCKMQFIEITKLSKIWRIKSNVKNPDFLRYKLIYNLGFVYLSGLVDFLNEYFNNPKAIVLFGSFRKGEDISSSDVDIAIESDEAEEYGIVRLDELVAFEKTINRSIQIHQFSRKKVDVNVFNNIANGIVLSGFLEVRP